MKRATPLLLAVLAVVLAGCWQPGAEMSPAPSAPETLAGTAWRAISVASVAPVAGREPTLAFASDTEIDGNTGCNGFFGTYTYAGGAIAFSQVGMTMMACDDPVGSVEATFTAALNAATTATIDDGGQLLLSGNGGDLLFKPDTETAR
jgi:heat shock protein HslJ